MRNQINNYQTYANNYKYVVARRVEGKLWFWGAWNDRDTANRIADSLGNGVVVTDQ